MTIIFLGGPIMSFFTTASMWYYFRLLNKIVHTWKETFLVSFCAAFIAYWEPRLHLGGRGTFVVHSEWEVSLARVNRDLFRHYYKVVANPWCKSKKKRIIYAYTVHQLHCKNPAPLSSRKSKLESLKKVGQGVPSSSCFTDFLMHIKNLNEAALASRHTEWSLLLLPLLATNFHSKLRRRRPLLFPSSGELCLLKTVSNLENKRHLWATHQPFPHGNYVNGRKWRHLQILMKRFHEKFISQVTCFWIKKPCCWCSSSKVVRRKKIGSSLVYRSMIDEHHPWCSTCHTSLSM